MKRIILVSLIAFSTAGCNAPKDTQVYDTPHNTYSEPIKTNVVEKTTPMELPNNFKMSENLISFGTDFDIDDLSGKNVGMVKERTLNLTNTFEYVDNIGTLKSRAEESFFSWGVEIIVYDENHKIIGYIQENILDGMFSIETIYSILDGNKKKIATSKKLDFIGTDIDIYTGGNLSIAMTRPYFNLMSDTWTVNIKDVNVDKRIAVFIPAYKTVADNRREEENNKNDK